MKSLRSKFLAPLIPWGVTVLILLFTVSLRVIDPLRQPIFGDEGINIYWAQAFARGHSTIYPFLMDGRFLLGALLGLVGIDGPAPLRYARLWIAVFAAFGGAASMALGRRLSPSPTRWATAWLAGVIYAVLPHAVFHERQALTDPMMGVMGALGLAGMMAVIHRPRPGWITFTALALAAAFLFKPSGVVYGLALGLAPLLVSVTPQKRWRALLSSLSIGLLALLFVGLFLWAFGPRLGVNETAVLDKKLGFIQCPPLVCHADWPAQWEQLQVVTPPLPEILAVDFGWPLLGCAGLGVVLGARQSRWRAAWLLAFVMGALVFFVFAGRQTLVPRYLTPLAAPLAALGAVGVSALLRSRPIRPYRFAVTVPVLGVLALPFINTTRLLTAPALAEVPAFDRVQYFTGLVAGGAFQAAALTIAAEDPSPLIITEHFMLYALGAFFDSRSDPVRNAWDVTWADAQRPWREGRAVYLVDEVAPEAATGAGWFFPYLNGARRIRARAVRATDPGAVATLYHVVYNAPDEIYSDYEAIAQAMAAQPPPTTVATYPPHQAPLLAQLLPHATHLTLGAATPWDSSAVISTLATAITDTSRLNLVFLNETTLDPRKEIETWLNSQCFPARQQWFGPVRWVTYVCGRAPTPLTITPALTFEGGLQLQQVTIFDPQTASGALVRVRLAWQTTDAVPRAYAVFAHVFNEQIVVAAQHDGQPMGELRPTTTWQPGETIHDQFAIPLPPDLPSGQYRLRVGLYDLSTQTRLPTTTGAEFWEGGEVVVK